MKALDSIWVYGTLQLIHRSARESAPATFTPSDLQYEALGSSDVTMRSGTRINNTLCGEDEPCPRGRRDTSSPTAFALLIERIVAIEAQGRLALTIVAAADLMWASANAASLLYVTAKFRNTVPASTDVLEDIRENVIGSILISELEG